MRLRVQACLAAGLLSSFCGCSSSGDGAVDRDSGVAPDAAGDGPAVDSASDAARDQGLQPDRGAIDSAVADAIDAAIADARGGDSTIDAAITDAVGDLFPPAPDGLPDGLPVGDSAKLGCGPVTYEGCCKGHVLYYCGGEGLLRIADCSANPECGWDPAFSLYDCATAGGTDPSGQHVKDCAF